MLLLLAFDAVVLLATRCCTFHARLWPRAREHAAPLVRLDTAGRAAAALLCSKVLFIWLIDD